MTEAWRSHRDRVDCGTRTSRDKVVADVASGPVIRCTILRLKVSEYGIFHSNHAPC